MVYKAPGATGEIEAAFILLPELACGPTVSNRRGPLWDEQRGDSSTFPISFLFQAPVRHSDYTSKSLKVVRCSNTRSKGPRCQSGLDCRRRRTKRISARKKHLPEHRMRG